MISFLSRATWHALFDAGSNHYHAFMSRRGVD
jgi:hypothetical protein